MNKTSKIKIALGVIFIAFISITAILKSTAQPDIESQFVSTWQFVPGSVTDGVTFKAAKNRIIGKKIKTISVCGIDAPNITESSSVESKQLLSNILKDSEKLELKMKGYINQDRRGKEFKNLFAEVYVVKENGEKISVARELFKSGKVVPVSTRSGRIERGLSMYGSCFVDEEEFKFFEEQADKLAKKRELEQNIEEPQEEPKMEISVSQYQEMLKTIEELKILRDQYIHEVPTQRDY